MMFKKSKREVAAVSWAVYLLEFENLNLKTTALITSKTLRRCFKRFKNKLGY